MKDSDRYLKVVTWSEEDVSHIGRAPGLVFGGCHSEPLPPATASRFRDVIAAC